MKLKVILLIAGSTYIQISYADHDIFVPGHYRSDGAYVRPHIKKSRDNSKANNYGPSQNDRQLIKPRERNYEQDNFSNYKDQDDDNDRIPDEIDPTQYGRKLRAK